MRDNQGTMEDDVKSKKSCTSTSHKIKDEDGASSNEKKPMSAFFFYMHFRRAQIKSMAQMSPDEESKNTLTDLNNCRSEKYKEMIKGISAEWAQFDESTRQTFSIPAES